MSRIRKVTPIVFSELDKRVDVEKEEEKYSRMFGAAVHGIRDEYTFTSDGGMIFDLDDEIQLSDVLGIFGYNYSEDVSLAEDDLMGNPFLLFEGEKYSAFVWWRATSAWVCRPSVYVANNDSAENRFLNFLA